MTATASRTTRPGALGALVLLAVLACGSANASAAGSAASPHVSVGSFPRPDACPLKPNPAGQAAETLANGAVSAPAREPEKEVIGLYYFRARYYSTSTGRFLQRDPVWDPNNMGNPYTFVGNSPITLTDPSGEIAPAVVLGLVGLGLLGGMEATGWGASAYTGDPGLEVAPSQMLYHAATGSSVFGGSRGFERASYSGGERVYQGVVGAASFLGGGLAGAAARGASVPAWLVGTDVALNVGLGAYETTQGHTIMGPLQVGLGLAGLGGLRGARAGGLHGSLESASGLEARLFAGRTVSAGTLGEVEELLESAYRARGLEFGGIITGRGASRTVPRFGSRGQVVGARINLRGGVEGQPLMRIIDEASHALDILRPRFQSRFSRLLALGRASDPKCARVFQHYQLFRRAARQYEAGDPVMRALMRQGDPGLLRQVARELRR